MRQSLLLLILLLLPLTVCARMVKDTVLTRHNDRIILTYDVSASGDNVSVRFDNRPRIVPGDNLRKACKGDLGLLKVVLFDRVGDFGNVKWKGISPTAFMVPSGVSYERSHDGFYILGETTTPISFTKKSLEKVNVFMPLYVAVYEKKQTYRIVGSGSRPMKIVLGKSQSGPARTVRTGTETERIAIQSSEELEADNEDLTKALSSIQMIGQLLQSETEVPFSQTLQMEIFNLRSLKDKVKDPAVIEKINEVLLQCNDKERELKESDREASLASQAEEKALMAEQKAEEQKQRKEAEERARVQEEKQQKRTLWMIIGGVILAVTGFVGNAIFKHFRDVRNQKSIMQMQESIARQAEHEAGRRAKELVRNKAHQAVNKGRSRMRQTLKETGKPKKNSNIKSI